jgi:hypothetical protein
MKTTITVAALAVFAAPAFADEGAATEAQRLDKLEEIVITADKEQPANRSVDQRMHELLIATGTAPKSQPAEHTIGDRTAALLDEIAKEEK